MYSLGILSVSIIFSIIICINDHHSGWQKVKAEEEKNDFVLIKIKGKKEEKEKLKSNQKCLLQDTTEGLRDSEPHYSLKKRRFGKETFIKANVSLSFTATAC